MNLQKNRMISEEDLQNTFNLSIKLKIQNCRTSLNTKLEKINWEIKILQDKLEHINEQLDKSNQKIVALQAELRFYEARILRYESLLTV